MVRQASSSSSSSNSFSSSRRNSKQLLNRSANNSIGHSRGMRYPGLHSYLSPGRLQKLREQGLGLGGLVNAIVQHELELVSQTSGEDAAVIAALEREGALEGVRNVLNSLQRRAASSSSGEYLAEIPSQHRREVRELKSRYSQLLTLQDKLAALRQQSVVHFPAAPVTATEEVRTEARASLHAYEQVLKDMDESASRVIALTEQVNASLSRSRGAQDNLYDKFNERRTRHNANVYVKDVKDILRAMPALYK
eukprot:gene26936-32548_t